MDDKIRTDGGSVGQCSCTSTLMDGTEELLARDVMQCGVVSIDRKEPVQKAVMVMIERNISGLPVTDEGWLDGMLSEKDLLRLLYESQYLPGQVEDYMTCGAVSFDVETPLAVIHKHLVEHSFRRVPILIEGRIAGMITRADLVRVYKEQFRPAGEAAPETDTELRGRGRHEIRAAHGRSGYAAVRRHGHDRLPPRHRPAGRGRRR